MNKNNKQMIIGGVAIALVAGIGGTVYTNYIVNKTKTEIQTESTERTELKNKTLKYLGEEHTPEEIETTLKDAFTKLDVDDNTQIVDTLLYGTYNAAAQYMISDDETNELYHVMDENKNFDLTKIEDTELKDKIQALNDQHVVVRYVNGNMFYDVDYGYFASTYGDYINPEYKGMLEFYDKEKKEDYYNEENDLLYTTVVENRLDQLYGMIQSYTTTDILALANECYNFYEAVYLGAYGQEYIFENGKIRQDIFDSYQKYKDVTKDEKMKSFLTELIDDYNEVSLDKTTPILEKIKSFCGLSTSDETQEFSGSSNGNAEIVESGSESNESEAVAKKSAE